MKLKMFVAERSAALGSAPGVTWLRGPCLQLQQSIILVQLARNSFFAGPREGAMPLVVPLAAPISQLNA